MTITPGVNVITRQITSLFSSTLWPLSVGIFHFCIWRPSKFSCMEFSFCIMFWSVKHTFTCQKWHFPSLLTWISFFHIKFANFWHLTCSVPTLIPIWPQSHGLRKSMLPFYPGGPDLKAIFGVPRPTAWESHLHEKLLLWHNILCCFYFPTTNSYQDFDTVNLKTYDTLLLQENNVKKVKIISQYHSKISKFPNLCKIWNSPTHINAACNKKYESSGVIFFS